MSRSAKELAAEYVDQTWRTKYVELCQALDLLSDCIIASDYTIPDEINEAIVLSQSGSALADRLIRKEGVPVKEAHLMCALTVGHEELFIDVDRSDVARILAAVGKQVISKEIRFPFIFGRELYDAYAEQFDDEKDELSTKETIALLDATPMGVYQYGDHVIGPLGILRSLESRSVRASRHVSAYHCAQPSCRAVHRVYLRTSQEAPINSFRDRIHRILDERAEQSAEWAGLEGEITGHLDAMYDDRDSALLVALVGEALDTEELRLLLRHLLDNTQGQVRSVFPGQHGGSSADMVGERPRAELLQLILLATETQIRDSLDTLIRAKAIEVPPGEVRRPVINRNRQFGAFALQPELGQHGVRYRSLDPGVSALRLRRLLKRLYLDTDEDQAELEWQLRGYDSERLEDRLEDFFRSSTPRESLSNLVLARRSNMITACHEVRLEGYESLSDSDLIDSILWRLGFDVHEIEDPHHYFWDLHDRITSLTQSSRISGTGESETFRGVASTYFSELEGILADSLAYATWALLSDHTTSSYEYDDELDRSAGLATLKEIHEHNETEYESFSFHPDGVELYEVFRGFDILATELDQLRMRDTKGSRPPQELPDYHQRTELKTFVFRSATPFEDLLQSSQSHMIDMLREVSRSLIAAKVNSVRNDYSHYRRRSQEIQGMARALEAIASAVRALEDLGLVRATWWPADVTRDPWGRSQHSFSGPRNRTFLIARPSSYDWLGLPGLGSPQYILQAAVFAEPNEVLRFRRKPRSSYSRLWVGYPNRRSGGVESLSQATHAQSLPRAEETERL